MNCTVRVYVNNRSIRIICTVRVYLNNRTETNTPESTILYFKIKRTQVRVHGTNSNVTVISNTPSNRFLILIRDMRIALRIYGTISSKNSEYETHEYSKVIHALCSTLHSNGTKSKINIVTQSRLIVFRSALRICGTSPITSPITSSSVAKSHSI
jgi:hypothetical protein